MRLIYPRLSDCGIFWIKVFFLICLILLQNRIILDINQYLIRPSEHERFMVWHEEMSQSNFVFEFKQEIVKYCRNDVNILQHMCMVFRKIFLERGDVCPFVECTTIASTCMKVFRKNFSREEIGIIPPDIDIKTITCTKHYSG